LQWNLEEFLEKFLTREFRLVVGRSSEGGASDREDVAQHARAKNRCKQRIVCPYEFGRVDVDARWPRVKRHESGSSRDSMVNAARPEMLDLGKKSHLAGMW
jgi:hypothetical protein